MGNLCIKKKISELVYTRRGRSIIIVRGVWSTSGLRLTPAVAVCKCVFSVSHSQPHLEREGSSWVIERRRFLRRLSLLLTILHLIPVHSFRSNVYSAHPSSSGPLQPWVRLCCYLVYRHDGIDKWNRFLFPLKSPIPPSRLCCPCHRPRNRAALHRRLLRRPPSRPLLPSMHRKAHQTKGRETRICTPNAARGSHTVYQRIQFIGCKKRLRVQSYSHVPFQ